MSLNNAPRRSGVVLALLACLVAALGGVVNNPASAASTAPVRIVVDSVTSDVAIPTSIPDVSVPYVVVKADKVLTTQSTVHIKVSFYDAAGALASFTKDTTLTIASNVGTLVKSTGIAPKGMSTVTIDTALTTAVNRVVFTVSAGSGAKAPKPGTSYIEPAPGVVGKDFRFDVLSILKSGLSSTSGEAFQEGVSGDGDCTNANEASPVCAILILPRGAGSDVLLSAGACDATTVPLYVPCYQGAKGASGAAILQALFAQPSTPYSVDSPATIVLKCDKLLCGTGPIRNLTVNYSFGGNSELLTDTLPCPAKNTMATPPTPDTPAKPCVDYVQSKRDGSGDTHLYLLTDRDIRTGIG